MNYFLQNPQLWVILISALIFIATEWFFPVRIGDPDSHNQRHFWSIVLTIFSLLQGLVITSSFRMQRQVEDVATVFRQLSDKRMEEQFRDIFVQYHLYFANGSDTLKSWVTESLANLDDAMKEGKITLPRELAPRELSLAYGTAKRFIVATNVGSTDFYFEDSNYKDVNKEALSNGIPVIRFFIWSDTRKIVIRKDERPELYEKDRFFSNAVVSLNEELGTVCSVLIDASRLKGRARDMLLVDGEFLAETNLSEDWEPLSAYATESQKNLEDARRYFRTVKGAIEPRYVACTDKGLDNLKEYRKVQASASGKGLGLQILDEVMDDVVRQRAR